MIREITEGVEFGLQCRVEMSRVRTLNFHASRLVMRISTDDETPCDLYLNSHSIRLTYNS